MSEQIMANNGPAGQNDFVAHQVVSQLSLKYRVDDEDGSMLAGLRKRHETAFAEMVRRYQHVLHTVALRITKNHEDAEEVVQDAFLKVFRHVESFRGDSLFRTWLTRVVTNEALMKIRKNPKHHISIDDHEDGLGSAIRELPAAAYTPEETCSLHEIQGMACGLFLQVSPASEPIVKLCLQMELSPAEAAEQLKLKLSTVKSRLFRGRKELRKALARHYSSRGRYPASRLTSKACSGCFPTCNEEMLNAPRLDLLQ